ncbi:Scr1 family TA system antitoxin-like transcriptional regulator [Nocardia gipuzkoensis]
MATKKFAMTHKTAHPATTLATITGVPRRSRTAGQRFASPVAGRHLGLIVQSFTLFDFPPRHVSRMNEPPVVFVEGFTGALFLEDDSVIQRHRATVANLLQVALSEDDTRVLVRSIAEEYAA